MIFKSNTLLEDRSHWKSKILKPVHLLKAGLGFLSQEVAFSVFSTPSLPSANLAKEALQAYFGVEMMFDLKLMSVSPARLVGLC